MAGLLVLKITSFHFLFPSFFLPLFMVPSSKPQESKVVLVVFLALLLDLLSFTIILPLFPRLLNFYQQHDTDAVRGDPGSMVLTCSLYMPFLNRPRYSITFYIGWKGTSNGLDAQAIPSGTLSFSGALSARSSRYCNSSYPLDSVTPATLLAGAKYFSAP
jgi:hypothetical protein